MMTFHDATGQQIIHGIAEELIQTAVKEKVSLGHVLDLTGTCQTITPIIPEQFERILTQTLKDAGVEIFLQTLVTDVLMAGNSVQGVYVQTSASAGSAALSEAVLVKARKIIDATGDAVVIAKAGGEFVLGREKDHKTQPASLIFKMDQVDLPKIWQEIKKNPQNFVLHPDFLNKPEKFTYLAVAGFFQEVKAAQQNGLLQFRDRALFFELPFQNAVSVNMTRVIDFDPLDEASVQTAYQKALVQIEECVQVLRTLPGFEQAKLAGIAPKLGIRETRHIVGEYTLTEEDLLIAKQFPDAIANGAFPIDLHSPDGANLKITKLNRHYQIPLRALQPKGLKNILAAGRCISATHEAHASLRTIPTCMAMGEGLVKNLSRL